jgi:thiamine biosynthesis protein ThiS
MKIIFNGHSREISNALTIRAFLDNLKLNPEIVAVELNLAIIPKNQYDNKIISEGDKIEIISFVGGG